MSILIKGMEVPESCYYCPFMYGSWGYSPPHKARCVITGKDMPVDERGVQHNQSCPLVPVPPHGRLIDADDTENITVVMNENGSGFNRIIAPTIIEAEGEDGSL